MNKHKHGFSHILVLVAVVLVAVVGFAGYRVMQAESDNKTENASNQSQQESTTSDHASDTTSDESVDCSEPLVLSLPVPIADVESIMYPGQIRGGDYKPHGGFRMSSTSNDVNVAMPMDAKVTKAARYLEQGELQYLFEFSNECQMRMRFDHLATVSSELQALADTLPEAKPDDSRTTNFNGPSLRKGAIVATRVGFVKNNNVSFDFGLYDDSKKNDASADSTWASLHQFENDQHGVCWFDYLSESDRQSVLALPATDMNSGKTSDYCK